MSEKSWQKREEINTLRYQINNFFDELINESTSKTVNVDNVIWEPAIEIKETDLNLILQAQVPGIEAKNLDIHVTQDTVVIAGEYHEQKVHNEKVIYHSEFGYGHFQRQVTLPVCVDYKQVKAEIHNGLLTLSLPKSNTEKYHIFKQDLTIRERGHGILVKQRQNRENIEKKKFKTTHNQIDTASPSSASST
ncbi:MAG: Hsp20/alpha crystallin family protein [Cyanobacteria bacterium P01_D01_bin.116]